LAKNRALCSSADDGLEGVVHFIERSVEPHDREVAGEQRSRDAEILKAVEDHFGETFERPVMIIDHEIGNLDRHIGRAAQDSETLSPTPHAIGITVDRAAAMVENEKLVRKGPRQSFRLSKLIGKDHQIEVRLQPCKADAPLRIVNEIAASDETARRVFAPTQDIANADHARKARLRLDQSRRLRARQRDVNDIALRDAIRFVECFEPPRFTKAVVARPTGFHMNAGDDVLPRRVATIVLRQVVAFERRNVPETATLAGADGEPRMAIEAQVPKMMMGVDEYFNVTPRSWKGVVVAPPRIYAVAREGEER
jgi:hypothetical protein